MPLAFRAAAAASVLNTFCCNGLECSAKGQQHYGNLFFFPPLRYSANEMGWKKEKEEQEDGKKFPRGDSKSI